MRSLKYWCMNPALLDKIYSIFFLRFCVIKKSFFNPMFTRYFITWVYENMSTKICQGLGEKICARDQTYE